MGESIWISQKTSRILSTGYKDFDDYFKILSGTCTIFYVCNQTYWDTVGLFPRWITNLFDDEFSVAISTRVDVTSATNVALKIIPDIFEKASVITKEERVYWIDMITAKGLSEGIDNDSMEGYREKLKSFELDPCTLYVVKNPEKRSSIDEVNSFIEEIINRGSKNMTGRIIVSSGDDLVDAWGIGKFLEFFRHQVNFLFHKFHHTGIYLLSYNSYPKKFHSKIERMADNILLWDYDLKKEGKYMQILKSPVIGSFFGKVPYKINEKNLPKFTLPTP